jgi:RHS repeat-associated protein
MVKRIILSGSVCNLAVGATALALFFAIGFIWIDLNTSLPNQTRVDDNGKIVSRTMPNGSHIRYGYDKGGNIIELSYHHIGGITNIVYPKVKSIRMEYDAVGNRVAMRDEVGLWRYAYDEVNRLKEVTAPSGKKISYAYDPWGQVHKIFFPDGNEVTYSYNILGQLTRIVDQSGAIEYEYREQKAVRKFPNGIKTLFEFTVGGQIVSIEHLGADGRRLGLFRYEYGPEGRVKGVEETTLTGTIKKGYDYDPLGRLIRIFAPEGTTEFTYDEMGNRTSRRGPDGTVAYLYDEDGRLVQAGEVRFKYDAAGNLIEKIEGSKRIEYQYDMENRLIQVSEKDNTVRYFYNGDGHRVAQEVDGKRTEYFYHSLSGIPQVIAQDGNNGNRSHPILIGSHVSAMITEGRTLYFLEDHLGSTRFAVTQTGDVIAEYDYSEFGLPQLKKGVDEAPFLFTGEQWDRQTGLIYLRARYYDPEIGRFLSQDPHPGSMLNPQSFNRYAYVENDPINRVDPLGLQPQFPPPPTFYDPNRDLRRFQDLRQERPSFQLFPTPPRPPIYYEPEPESSEWFRPFATQVREYNGKLSITYPPEKTTFYDRLSNTGRYYSERIHANPDLQAAVRCAALICGGPIRYATKALELNEAFHDLRHGEYRSAAWNFFDVFAPERIPFIGDTKNQVISLIRDADDYKDAFSSLWSSIKLHDKKDLGEPIFDQGNSFPSVGGVYLDQATRIIGSIGAISGALYDARTNQFILIGEKNSALPFIKPEYLAEAIRAVYKPSATEPGMTIDPMPQDPHGPLMVVQFFGNTENTRIGNIMFESDRIMKGLSVGRDNLTKEIVLSAVPGYRSVTRMSLEDPKASQGLWSRFWLVPEPVTARVSADGNSVLFDPIRIRVKTETMRWAGGKLVPARGTRDPHAEAFAAHLTEHYDKFAREYPAFAELKQVTQAVSLAKWMKEQGIQIDWNLLRTLAGRPVDTPELAPSAFHQEQKTIGSGRGISSVSSFGGVEMVPILEAVRKSEDQVLFNQLSEAWEKAKREKKDGFQVKIGEKSYEAAVIPMQGLREVASYSLAESDLDLFDQGRSKRKEIPGLTRYYNSLHNEPSEFAFSWSLLLPKLTFENTVEGGGLRFVSFDGIKESVMLQRFALTDPFGLVNERFIEAIPNFNLGRVGFAPERRESIFTGLYPEGKDRYRLFFKNGDQALFDGKGNLRALFSQGLKAVYDYGELDRLVSIYIDSGDSKEEVRFAYDQEGRIDRMTFGEKEIFYHYGEDGNLDAVASGGKIKAYRYDSRRLLTEVMLDGKRLLRNQYNERGQLTLQEEVSGSKMEQVIENTPNGKVITTKKASGFVKAYYDKHMRMTRLEDSAGSALHYSHDAEGRLIGVEASLSTGATSKVTLSPEQKLLSVENSRGVRTEYHFTPAGKLGQIRIDGKPVATYRHDERERRVESRYEGGFADHLEYDQLGHITRHHRTKPGEPAAETVELLYNREGRLSEIRHSHMGDLSAMINPAVVQYDENDRPTRIEGKDGSVLLNRYGQGGRLESITIAKNSQDASIQFLEDRIIEKDFRNEETIYGFDKEGLLVWIMDPLGQKTSYSYNKNKQLQQIALLNGRCAEYIYESERKGMVITTQFKNCSRSQDMGRGHSSVSLSE